MGANFRGVKFRVLPKHLNYKVFKGFIFCGFVMGVITTPFSDYSGQWLDESNEGAPFSSLSCPVTGRVLA